MRLSSVNNPAKINGLSYPPVLNHDFSDNIPPRKGPTVNPIPLAILIRPKFLLFSPSLLKSAITAPATAAFPAATPTTTLPKRRRMRLFERTPNALRKYPARLRMRVMIKTGFLPFKSDNDPKMGELKNWESGMAARSIPSQKPLIRSEVA